MSPFLISKKPISGYLSGISPGKLRLADQYFNSLFTDPHLFAVVMLIKH